MDEEARRSSMPCPKCGGTVWITDERNDEGQYYGHYVCETCGWSIDYQSD